MKTINSSAVKRALWTLSLSLTASFVTLTTTGCFGGGDKKDKEEVGPDDAAAGEAPKADAAKKDHKKKGKKDKKKKDHKKKGEEGADGAAKDPM